MKKTVVLIMFVCGFSAAYSQDLVKEIQKLTLANDSLQKELKLVNSNLDSNIRFYNDSISRLIAAHNAEIAELNKKMSKAEKDLTAANNKVANLDKNKVKTERDNLQQQVNALQADTAALRQQLSEKDNQIADAKADGNKKAQEQYNLGQQNALSQIERSYQENFDNLIKSSTIQAVKRDLPLIENQATVKKLQDLQKYFDAKQVLSEQYNEQKVKYAQTQAGSLEQTELVKNLTEKLGKYKLCNDGLKASIGKIQEIDRKFTANDDYSQQTKLQDIMSELSGYFRNYRFNFTDYPYLADTVLEIMKLKQRDANTDISDLLRKL